MKLRLAPILLAATVLAVPAVADAGIEVSLKGSRASMLRQNRVAKDEQYSFLRTPTQVARFVDNGLLVELPGNRDYAVIAGYPYARSVVAAFIERLAADYRAMCGEKLVVTSLTRPAARQPRNASALSVHPAGMAVDLRVSSRSECRNWLSQELLRLEDRGLIDGTREYHPPHFHVAVFPGPYADYEQNLRAEAAAAEAARRLERAVAMRAVAAREPEVADVALEAAAVPVPEMTFMLRVALLLTKLFLPIPV